MSSFSVCSHFFVLITKKRKKNVRATKLGSLALVHVYFDFFARLHRRSRKSSENKLECNDPRLALDTNDAVLEVRDRIKPGGSAEHLR